MPIYSIHIGAVQHITQTELPVKFCIVGKRRDDFEKPSDELLAKTSALYQGPPPFTEEELMEAKKYRYAKSHGKYVQKALAWAESEEQADEMKSRFNPTEWDVDSFTLVPVKEMP